MSDHDFERYLAILCGVLRITSSRREEISAELRDHLEERLTELLDQGMPRDKAIVTALEEFGDAAGLAAEFLHIMRKQRRRWYMKATLTGVLATVVLFVTAMAMWPENAPVRGTNVIAQDKAAAEAPPAISGEGGSAGGTATPFDDDSPPPPAAKKGKRSRDAQPTTPSSTMEDNNAATEQKLSHRIAAQYPNTPLMDVLTDISTTCEFEFIVNHRRITESGKAVDVAIDLNIKKIRADMLLDIVLRDAGLVYTVRDGIVLITTQDDMASTMEVRVYNCRDLVGLSSYPGSMGQSGEMMGMPGMGPAATGEGTMGGVGGPGMSGGFGGSGGAMGGAPGGMGGMAMPGMSGMPGMGMGSAAPGMPGGGRMSGGMGMAMPGTSGMSADGQGMSSGGGHGLSASHYIPDMGALIAVLTNTVAPDTWSFNGGAGSIEPYYGGLLVVNNNPQAHEKIEKLLKMMRLAAIQQPGTMIRDK